MFILNQPINPDSSLSVAYYGAHIISKPPFRFRWLYTLARYYTLYHIYQARARSAGAQTACALRALVLLLADGAPTVGRGKTF